MDELTNLASSEQNEPTAVPVVAAKTAMARRRWNRNATRVMLGI